jgi:hypothetical protein
VISAYGVSVQPPAGWDARIYRRDGGDPTLHAASFPLPAHDADFGSAATEAMPPGGVFVVITEYRPGGGLAASQGLFAPAGVPRALAAHHFDPRVLHRHRPDRVGLQRFFTVGQRPFCLYAVIRSRYGHTARVAPDLVGTLNQLLDTVRITPHPFSAP